MKNGILIPKEVYIKNNQPTSRLLNSFKVAADIPISNKEQEYVGSSTRLYRYSSACFGMWKAIFRCIEADDSPTVFG